VEKTILRIMILAAYADGVLQDAEKSFISRIKSAHPLLAEISEGDTQEILSDLIRKIDAGMETHQILEVYGRDLDEKERNSLFALAKEVCAADFNVFPAETEFLKLLEKEWNINVDVVSAADESIRLRYGAL
jgi:uncharacterized membrane protein YebE (DUF533 family)